MDFKWVGAVLIIAGCGGYGFLLCASDLREIRFLRDLIRCLEYMTCELQFRMPPLPDVCLSLSREIPGTLGHVFGRLGESLQSPVQSEVSRCLDEILAQNDTIPPRTRKNLNLLGASLGRFDLSGQLRSLEAVRAGCKLDLEELERGRASRLRCYQTLGLCSGAALAILLI